MQEEIIVVGAGVGGATVAKELAKRGKKVTILEKGRMYSLGETGTEMLAFKFYDKYGLWSKTKEGVVYYRTIMVGGTSVVSCGNAVRSMEKELRKKGIDLRVEFREAEKELGVRSVPSKFIGKATSAIMQAAHKLGYAMQPMPKLINFKKCVACGNCVVGCLTGAKWSALNYVKEAQENGASLVTSFTVKKVLISKGKAFGVEGVDKTGKDVSLYSDKVILAAGGLETPLILLNSGIKAGEKLFLDLFTVTMGHAKDSGQSKELTMAAVHINNGFLLSPFLDTPFALASVVPVPLRRNLKIMAQRDRMLGIMVKIEDDTFGRVRKDGTIEKKVSIRDLARLKKGEEISRKILIKAGADPDTIITTKMRGAHPGGTAAIGKVVDKNLQTKIKNLFIADASVLSSSPGLPPIVTIIALAKKLAKNLP